MDNYSEVSKLSDEEQVDLTDYTKEKLDLEPENYYSGMNTYDKKILDNDCMLEKYNIKNKYNKKNLNQTFDESITKYNYNQLKRKHTAEKLCEFCGSKSTNDYLTTSKLSKKALCHSCYEYERRTGKLIPPAERLSNWNFRNHKLNKLCEYCGQKSSNGKLVNSKTTPYGLCHSCYLFELRHKKLIPKNERLRFGFGKHQNSILVCEFCQKDSKSYQTGKVSGKSLCMSCYYYEYKHGRIIPLAERKKLHNAQYHILVCQYCQEESPRYSKSTINDQILCIPCYKYEYNHGNNTLTCNHDNNTLQLQPR
jgi:formylmethanofuran dehydrogenase subunit E